MKECYILPRKFSEEKFKTVYSAIAPFYDVWSKFTEAKATKKALELANIRERERILEAAVGTGLVFEQIVKQNKNGENIGIDISPGMLTRTQKRLQKCGLSNFCLQVANAYHMPFENNTFDLIINNYMFDLLPEETFTDVLEEFKRILKPSGRIVISTMSFGDKWYNKTWYKIAKYFPFLLLGCRPICLHNYLVSANFINIETERISQCTFPTEIIRAKKSSH